MNSGSTIPRPRIATIGAAFLLSILLPAASATGQLREWVDSTSDDKILAEFIELDDEAVRVKRSDGQMLDVPLDRLRPSDLAFARREAVRQAAELPELGAAGQMATEELLVAIREALADYASVADLSEDSLLAAGETGLPIVRTGLEKIVAEEGHRRAAAPAIVAMLQDMNLAVRAIGLLTMREMGAAAYPIGPAAARLTADPAASVRELATEQVLRMAERTDTPLAGLVPMILGSDVRSANETLRILARMGASPPRGFAADGPRAEATMNVLAEAAMNDSRAPIERVRALLSLAALAGRLVDRDEERDALAFDRDDRSAQEERRQRKRLQESLAGRVAPLLDRSNVQVQTAAARFLAVGAPEHLTRLSPEAFWRLLTSEDPHMFGEAGEGLVREFREFRELGDLEEHSLDIPSAILDDDDDILVSRLLELVGEKRLNVELAPARLVALIGSERRDVHDYARSQLDQLGDDASETLWQLSKLADDRREHVRRAVVAAIAGGAFDSPKDVAELPVLSIAVEADAQGAVAAIKFGNSTAPAVAAGASSEAALLPGIDELGEAIAAWSPAKAQEEPAVEEILGIALRAGDEGDLATNRMAIDALARRGTSKAIDVLNAVSENSLRPETRELASDALRRIAYARGEDGDFDEDSPFGGLGALRRVRDDIAVRLTLPPKLLAEEASRMLTVLAAAKVAAVRIAEQADAEATPTPRREFSLRPSGSYRWNSRNEYRLVLSPSKNAGGDARVRMRASSGKTLVEAPNLDAVTFLLTSHARRLIQLGIARSPPSPPSPIGEQAGAGAQAAIGAHALPMQISIECEPGVRFADVAKTLAAVGSTRAGERPARDLIQWLRLAAGEQAATEWFLTVVEATPSGGP